MGAAAGAAGGATTGDNHSATSQDTRVGVGGGSTLNLNLSSAGIRKGLPTWAVVAGVVALAFVAWRMTRK